MRKSAASLLSLLLVFSGQLQAASLATSGTNNGGSSTEVSGLSVTNGQLVTSCAPIIYTSSQTPTAGDFTKTAGSATIGTPTLDKYLVLNTGNAPYYLGLAYFSVLVTGSGSLSMTVTPNGGSAAVGNHLAVWNGTWDSSRVESAPTIASSATDNQTTHSSASVSSAGAAVFLGCLALLQTVNASITQDAAFTLLSEYENGTTGVAGGASYRIVATATTDTSDYTSTGATNYGWLSGALVYKEVGGGGGGTAVPVFMHHLNQQAQ